MLTQCVQTGIMNLRLRFTVSWLVAAVLTLQLANTIYLNWIAIAKT